MTTHRPVGRYHTNDSGRTLPCTAGVRECHFTHGSTPAESADNWQKQMEDNLIPAPENRVPVEERVRHYRETPLKRMDDSDLAEAIILEGDELGFDTAKLSEAIALASELHGKQFRKGARGNIENPPYIEHPLRNSLRLLRLGVQDEKIIVASVLHDAVEDGSDVFLKSQGASNREARDQHAARKALTIHIEKRFGRETTETVIAVTNEIPSGDHRAMSQDEKHQIYVNHMAQHVAHSPSAYLVKISDFIDNATGLYHNVSTMDKMKVQGQAKKYSKAIPVFIEALDKLELPIPERSKNLLRSGLTETSRRLQKIAEGWDGTGKI